MTKREKIIAKTKEFVLENEPKYGGCGGITFTALADAFRAEGMEIFTPEEEETILRGMLSLSGGTAREGIGTCGAVTSACFVISYISGIGTKEMLEDVDNRSIPILKAQAVTEKCIKEWGSICCNDMRYRRAGRTYNFKDPNSWAAMEEFMKTASEICGHGTINSVPATVSGWAAEAICDMQGIA